MLLGILHEFSENRRFFCFLFVIEKLAIYHRNENRMPYITAANILSPWLTIFPDSVGMDDATNTGSSV